MRITRLSRIFQYLVERRGKSFRCLFKKKKKRKYSGINDNFLSQINPNSERKETLSSLFVHPRLENAKSERRGLLFKRVSSSLGFRKDTYCWNTYTGTL